MKRFSVREIARHPSILKIDPWESILIEDRKLHKILGLYIGSELAKEFELFLQRKRLLDAAQRIKEAAKREYKKLEGCSHD
ncbi:MAG: hypothetical protein GXO19_07555 [Epsilonproteobacteria bacterium]|nr:hypothetical protein [Campylobacterota bacterium]NPA57568.1 hypothetical protein [Campylobacterota bacterium]